LLIFIVEMGQDLSRPALAGLKHDSLPVLKVPKEFEAVEFGKTDNNDNNQNKTDNQKPNDDLVTFEINIDKSKLKPRIVGKTDIKVIPVDRSQVNLPPPILEAPVAKKIATPAEDPNRSPFRHKKGKKAAKVEKQNFNDHTPLGSVRDAGPVVITSSPKVIKHVETNKPDSDEVAMNLFGNDSDPAVGVSHDPVFMTTASQNKESILPSLPVMSRSLSKENREIVQLSGRKANDLGPVKVEGKGLTPRPVRQPETPVEVYRAVLIGINYLNRPDNLRNQLPHLCISRIQEMSAYLRTIGFDEQTFLTDDPDQQDEVTLPNSRNILDALARLAGQTKPRDKLFIYFYGVTGKNCWRTTDGVITSEQLYSECLSILPAGSNTRIIMDLCQPSVNLQLPYKYVYNGPKNIVACLPLAGNVLCITSETVDSDGGYPVGQGALTFAFLQSCMEIRNSGKFTLDYNWKSLMAMITFKLMQNNYDQVPVLYGQNATTRGQTVDVI
jgi:hypothetical protein